jgi:hypothetical protein
MLYLSVEVNFAQLQAQAVVALKFLTCAFAGNRSLLRVGSLKDFPFQSWRDKWLRAGRTILADDEDFPVVRRGRTQEERTSDRATMDRLRTTGSLG